jgi:hypothetical protein
MSEKKKAKGKALRRSQRDLQRLSQITRPRIDEARDLARAAGAQDFMEADPVSKGEADDEES